MKRKVTYAKLHDLNIVVPGVGTLSRDLPPTNKTLNLEMHYTPEGLHLHINGKECMIPLANVQFAILAPEAAPTPAAKK